MKRRIGRFAVFLLLLSGCWGGGGDAVEPGPLAVQPDTAWELYVLAGQSNMVGFAPLDGHVAPELGDRVFALQGGSWLPARDPIRHYPHEAKGVGPATSFARYLLETGQQRRVGLLPCAAPSSAIHHWAPSPDPASLYGNCLAMAALARPTGRVRGILFFQGESDGIRAEGSRSDQWGERFAELVAALRRDLGDPRLPVVFAQIGNLPPEYQKNYQADWLTVQREQAEVRIDRVGMIRVSDLPGDGGLHYPLASYIEIGRRFGQRLREIQAIR